jgi:SAM-dependent methyltransferase
MSEHGHTPGGYDHAHGNPGHEHGHGGHGHGPVDEAGLAEMLELDGTVLSAYLKQATSWIAELAAGPVRRVADLGAGTGTGSRALASAFPQAAVVAVDRSPAMLARVRAACGERVETLEADLANGLPELGRPDVIWAAMMLHEVPEPSKIMAQAREALAPGGLLVIAEMDSMPRFLDGDPLEERLHAAIAVAQKGVNPHPDWTRALAEAGFDAVERRRFAIDVDAPQADVVRYAEIFLRRFGGAVAGELLGAQDRAALSALLEPGRLAARKPVVHAGRTVWAARRS